MAFPGILCTTVKATPHQICVVMPGGQEVCVQLPQASLGDIEVVKQLIAQINAALAPMAQYFTLADVVISIFKCVQKIPDLIPTGPTSFPTPDKVAEVVSCFSELIEKINEIIRQLPPFTIPAMLLDVANALLIYLEGLKNELQSFIDQQVAMLAAATKADELGNFRLKAAVDCRTNQLSVALADLRESTQPLNRFFAMLKFFGDLVGGAIPGIPDIPEIPDLIGQGEAALGEGKTLGEVASDLAGSLSGLDDAINVLKAFRDGVQQVKDTIGSPPTL